MWLTNNSDYPKMHEPRKDERGETLFKIEAAGHSPIGIGEFIWTDWDSCPSQTGRKLSNWEKSWGWNCWHLTYMPSPQLSLCNKCVNCYFKEGSAQANLPCPSLVSLPFTPLPLHLHCWAGAALHVDGRGGLNLMNRPRPVTVRGWPWVDPWECTTSPWPAPARMHDRLPICMYDRLFAVTWWTMNGPLTNTVGFYLIRSGL